MISRLGNKCNKYKTGKQTGLLKGNHWKSVNLSAVNQKCLNMLVFMLSKGKLDLSTSKDCCQFSHCVDIYIEGVSQRQNLRQNCR